MHQIYHDVTISAEAEDIFNAVTTEEGLNIWWTQQSSGQALLDEEYRFYFSEDYDWRAKVIQVIPNALIAYQMTHSDEDWNDTILMFKIIAKSDRENLLRFEHSGWQKANDHYRRSSFCWALYLNDLKKHLESENF